MSEKVEAPPSKRTINPQLLHSDIIVLQSLYHDLEQKPSADKKPSKDHDTVAIQSLRARNDPNHPDFEPSVFSMYDDKDIHPWLNVNVIRPYRQFAMKVVRHPTDVVFLTHILWNLLIVVPSALYLFYNFTYLHAVVHTAHAIWCASPLTLLLHNHIHNNGVLAKSWKWFDLSFPYLLEPLVGHTWDSYYFHHVKHHHVESNGPDDLSSTIRYQRDSLLHFLHYEGRFLFLIWFDLPRYFLKKNQPIMALRAFASETTNYAFLYYMTFHVNTRASVFVFIIPLIFLRLALMIGNWGQHALVDELEPDSDLRSSITLIDVPSNRICFNDGYHTSHHLNPRRHWRDQPVHFMQQKEAFAKGRALVFYDIDFLMMTIKLLSKDYMYLAGHLIPMGEQMNMSQVELAEMLRTKTRKFTEEDIRQKFKLGSSSE